MPDNEDDLILVLRSQIEQRSHEQLKRRHKVNPYSDRRRAIELQINQQRERLERIAGEFNGQDKHRIAEFVRTLIDGYLPELAHDLKQR